MNDQDIRTRALGIIRQAVNAVFISTDDEGYPHARTMWTAGTDDDFTIFFVTGRNLVKCKQIEANPKVCMFWTQVEGNMIGWNYAMLKGNAQVKDDQAIKDRFWTDMLKEYFPQGKEDPNYVVIEVKPKELLLMDSHKYPLDRIEF